MFLIFLPKINILIYHFIPIKEREFFSRVPKRENNKKKWKKNLFWISGIWLMFIYIAFVILCRDREGEEIDFISYEKSQIPSTLIYWQFWTSPIVDHREKIQKKSLKFLRYPTKYLNYDCVEEILIGFCVSKSRSFRYISSSMESFILSHLTTKILISSDT